MFLYDFIQVDVPFEDVRARVLEGGASWLTAIATATYTNGQTAIVEVGPESHPRIRKEVVIVLEGVYENDGFIRVPFHWRATGIPGLFPTLDGDIEVARLGDGRTHICLMGRYSPPLSAIGRVLDRMVFHHLAEGTVRSFLQRLGSALLETPAPVQS